MIKHLALTAFMVSFSMQSLAISNKEICNARADLMASIAHERDKGKSKKQVKQMMKNNLNSQLPPAFDTYLDAVYEGKKYSPNEIKIISLYSCHQEFGLIK